MSLLGKAWQPFRSVDVSPASLGYGDGWCRQLDRSWTNGHYAVMARDIDTSWGRVTHLFITARDAADLP